MVRRLPPNQGEDKTRKYKHVYWHKKSQTWQAVRRGYAEVACHPNQEQVAVSAAKAWGVNKDSLRLAESDRKPGEGVSVVRRYKYIVWHSARKTWIVQQGNKYVGSSTDLDTAVEIACKHFMVNPEDIRLDAPKRTNSTRTDSCERFAILMRVYKGKNSNEPMVPCDLQDLLQRVDTSRVLRTTQARGLVFPWLLSKFPKHRDIIEESLTISNKNSEVENLYDSLVKASVAISKVEHCDEELRNVGRKNMHHSNFTVLVSKSLKLLRKAMTTDTNAQTKLHSKASSKILLMGKSKAAYTVCRLNIDLRKKFQHGLNLGRHW